MVYRYKTVEVTHIASNPKNGKLVSVNEDDDDIDDASILFIN